MATIGSVIDGKYEILTLVGKGGMSKVYLAMDKRLNKQWAVKEIEKKARDRNNEIVIQSAIAEANMIKRLDHPALPRIVDIIDNGNVIYVIMDYIEGETLQKVVDELGAQDQETVIDWALQLCEVLNYLHSCDPPIIYRDMKPANIMLRPDGNIKLIDFGIAREYKVNNIADTVSLGTKGYAAPEQFGGKGQTDGRTDIYCLGVTLYHLVTGQNPCEPPYELYPIRHWNSSLSAGLENIIQKCTQLNPEDRYQSCAELLYALEHYDEVDGAYRKNQVKKLKAFIVSMSLFIVFLFTGILGNIMKTKSNNADYSNNIQMAQAASDDETKINYYLTAVDIKPYAVEAYLGLIDVYKYDTSFSVAEEDQFKSKINENLVKLKENSSYADLAFEIGKIYWYYYEYGKEEGTDNQITRMKSAIQWFDDVVKFGDKNSSYYQIANVYSNIGKFNRDITLNVEEASDKGLYKPYWENISGLLDILSKNENENEIVKLELYKLTTYSIETYSKKFKADGVTRDELSSVLELIENELDELDVTTDKTLQMKLNIENRFDKAAQAIELAYNN